MRMPTQLPTLTPISPTQAAQAVGTSRRTVMRAIERQELPAFRDNRNHWKITPQALESWADAHRALTGQIPALAQPTLSDVHLAPPFDYIAELQAEQEARRQAEVEAGELRGKLAATEAERDRLNRLVERLTQPQAKRRSWWPF